ncbi:protein FAR1-RELATED SEQUENCE 5-like [Rosa chinensis]|uniref:protein FAR1-RELATED SEQUENCE 5-like n=1 Tax=Rosa chinensis TaxID=74649 RepID=UPI001AD8C2D2|nr:protein FAR1-RELATED SEQUENCE 5-like [Rosa chinensis]
MKVVQNFNLSSPAQESEEMMLPPRAAPPWKDTSGSSGGGGELEDEVDIPIYQQFELFETQAGGHANVGCTERDLRNAVRDEREEVKGHDVDILYEHFKAEQEKDPDFFFEFYTDEENRLVRCLWVDSIGKKSYTYFGDVVVFDTTYNTNRYKMIFAPIVGVNHHGQTIVFGCAFLSDETFDSFVWLLTTWLAAMPKSAPNVIITDQDQAISKAIAHVLPNTFHRYCVWHILKKFPEKTNVAFMQEYYQLFKTCIWDSECPEEFEKRWFEALEKSQQTNNEWLEKMYELRGRWIPAYVNKNFSAGMSSSQRVESAHAFFKCYCDKENTLMDFVTRFNRAVAHQRHEELVEDHRDLNETPNLKLGMPMEVQMAQLYTKKYFQYFQAQLHNGNGYIINAVMEDNSRCVYKTERVFAQNLRMRTLVYDKISKIVICSCKMFEFEGIPCRHILALLRLKQIMELPKEYILRRWTRFSRICRDSCQGQDGADNSLIMRHNGMFKIASGLIDEAAISLEGTELVQKAFEGLMEQIKKLNLSIGQASIKNSSAGTSRENHFLDPSRVKTKGSGKRITSWRHRKRKVRHCSKCQSTKHTKKTCTFDRSEIVENAVNKALGEQDYLIDEL